MNQLLHRSKHQRNVDRFMRLAKQDLPAVPTMPDEDTRILRAKLILEEALETIERGLGIKVGVRTDFEGEPVTVWLTHEDNKIEFNVSYTELKPDLVELIDGCCDIRVVTTGTLSACGIPDQVFQTEVDETNLKKFGPGSYKREDGKWMKPPDWYPPQIQHLLDRVTEVAQKVEAERGPAWLE